MQIRYRLEIKPPYIRILKSGTRTNAGLDRQNNHGRSNG
jgi:hypothetical protein